MREVLCYQHGQHVYGTVSWPVAGILLQNPT